MHLFVCYICACHDASSIAAIKNSLTLLEAFNPVGHLLMSVKNIILNTEITKKRM